MRKLYFLLLTSMMALAGTLQAQDSCRSEFNIQQMSGNAAPFVIVTTASAWNNHQRPVISLCWNWGDGTPQQCSQGTGANPPAFNATHTYLANGTYTITLTVTHDGGCVSHFTRSIILPAPNTPPDSCRANFTHAILNAGAIAQLVAFTPQPWHSNQRPVTRICYNFGDGRDTCINYSSTTPAPMPVQHFYAQPGTYNACVTITYEGGCQSTSCHAVVLVSTPPPPAPDSCRAEFTSAPWFQHPRGRALTAHAWHNYQRPVTKICWQFGDGRDTCVLYPQGYNGQPIFHDYPAPGNYNTCLTIHYQGGCQSNRCQQVNVPQPPPDSCHTTLTVLPVTATPMARRFTANPFHNNGKRVTRICWLFGDGRDTCINYTAATTANYSVEHTFLQLGNYTVCAQVQFDGGCQSTGCAPVMVQSVPQPPAPDSLCTAGFQVVSGNVPGERKFQAYPTPNRRPTEVCWYFGDGQHLCVAQPDPATQASLSALHTYSNPGNYQVCVRIRYANGCVAQFCQNVFVTGPGNCSASFTDTALTERIYRFVGSGTVDAGDSIISYKWSFGDGTQSFGRNVTHTFFNGGAYQVCLVTRTRNGCEARTCRTINVNAPNIALLTLVPNPVSTTLHANFLCSGAQGMATIRIITATGLIVRTETRPCYPGMNFWNFNVASLPTGFYTMNVQTATQFVSAGFFKQ